MGRMRVLAVVVMAVALLPSGPGVEAATPPYRLALVDNIASGGADANPFDFAALGRTMVFSAETPSRGRELWRTRGTAATTRFVKDINPGSTDGVPDSGDPFDLLKVGGKAFFTANDGVNGTELWKTDGTAAGTVMVKDINPGVTGTEPDSSFPGDFAAFGNTLIFSADDGTNGTELWRSDGTAAGTTMVKDIRPGANTSVPGDPIVFGGFVYFRAFDGTNGFELWRTDGTPAGTTLFKDIEPGAGSSFPFEMAAVGSLLFIGASTAGTGDELWKSNGTAAGTVMVKDINPGADSANVFGITPLSGSVALFSAFTATSGRELWKSNGTAAGTVLVKDINPGSTAAEPHDGDPFDLIMRRSGQVLFSANGGGARGGDELWRSDGTTAGTVRVKDINPGHLGSFPGQFELLRREAFFDACTENDGCELWRSNGTESGTKMVRDVNPGANDHSPGQLTRLGARLLYNGTGPDVGDEVFKVGPTFSIVDREIVEGDDGSKRMRFVVKLSRPPAAQVSILAVTREGSAERGEDYRHKRQRLRFDAGDRREVFLVRIFGDMSDESNERFRVILRAARGADIRDSVGRGTILDDD